jgi:DNA primase
MTLDETEDILERLGIEIISIRGSEIQAHCPAHLERTGKEDSNPSWYINADTGKHICFSCQFKGGLTTLIGYMQGDEYIDTKEWLDSGSRDLRRAFERMMTPKPIPQKVENDITESMLKAFTVPSDEALLSRGISPTAAAYYEILWDAKNLNWITVIRNPFTNKLLGWQEKGYKQRYFRNYPSGVEKSSSLFGFKQYESGPMIVVESPLDVARLASVKVLGGVSTYGAAVSHAQLNLIRGAERIIIAMDNDDAGRASSENLLKAAHDMHFECWFFNYSQTDRKDVGGMSKSEIVWGLENARHSMHGRKAFL